MGRFEPTFCAQEEKAMMDEDVMAMRLVESFEEVRSINQNMDKLQQLFPAAMARRHSFGGGGGGDGESSSGSLPGSPTGGGPLSPTAIMSPTTAAAVGRRRRESMAAVCEALTLARSVRSSLESLQAKAASSQDLEPVKAKFVADCRDKLKGLMGRFTSETIEDAVETAETIRSPRSPRSFRSLSFR